ncbi:hypothetical protein CLG_B2200, partial [Clostridium phage D-1873]
MENSSRIINVERKYKVSMGWTFCSSPLYKNI